MKTFEEYTKSGAGYDVMEALRLLTEAYMQECGVSLGFRTVVYYALSSWKKKLEQLNLPLSEVARESSPDELMSLISENYSLEEFGEYMIRNMTPEQLKDCCRDAIRQKEFDEDTLAVLCWGIEEVSHRATKCHKQSNIGTFERNFKKICIVS